MRRGCNALAASLAFKYSIAALQHRRKCRRSLPGEYRQGAADQVMGVSRVLGENECVRGE